jgi:acetyltransferase EpsM
MINKPMTEPNPIVIPLINPNEPGALLAALHVSPGQHVSKGDKLCTLETTKSTVELIAEQDGFFAGFVHEVGQTLEAGEILAYLADSPDWTPPEAYQPEKAPPSSNYERLRISKPALALAQQHQLDLTHFSSEIFITEQMLREMIDQSVQTELELSSLVLNPDSIMIYGGGGHGKALIDLIRSHGAFSVAGIVDDGLPAGTSIMGVPVLGGSNSLVKLHDQGLQFSANAVGGIGNITSRINVFDRLARAGYTCPTLVHPAAFVEPSATLAEGVQVMPHAYVGSEARLGFGAIVNTGAIVSHDCVLGEYANLSPGAILAGEVIVGDATLVGMGVTVNLRVKIGNRARLGNGATIKQDVPDGSVVRAGSIWPE